MNFSTACFPVLHYFLEFAQTHVHWVGDTIQPSHLLLPVSPPALRLSRNQHLFQSRLFTSGGQSIGASGSASVLSMNIRDSLPLGLTGLISLQSKGHKRVFFSTIVQKHQVFSAQPSLWSNSLICTLLLEKPELWLYRPLLAKWCLCFLTYWLPLSWLSYQEAIVF